MQLECYCGQCCEIKMISIPKKLTYLGRAVELCAEDKTYRWSKSKEYALCTPTGGKKLIILKQKKWHKGIKDNNSADLYELFTEWKADCHYTVKLTDQEFTKVGRAVHIVYESDKWGQGMAEYIHKFEKMPLIYKTSDRNFIITGGRISITSDGIEG